MLKCILHITIICISDNMSQIMLYVLYNIYSGCIGDYASITLDLDISQLAEAEYRMKYIFFQNDDLGNNIDIEVVRGLCIDKKIVGNNQSDKLIWRPRNFGYIILPTPDYYVCEG